VQCGRFLLGHNCSFDCDARRRLDLASDRSIGAASLHALLTVGKSGPQLLAEGEPSLDSAEVSARRHLDLSIRSG